jgi:hypothetical protein
MNVNAKKIPVEIILKWRKERIKEIGGGGKFKYDIFYIL